VKGQNADTTHRVLDSILSGVVTAQLMGGIKCSMRDKFNITRELCFKVPICFVIGDVEGHNVLNKVLQRASDPSKFEEAIAYALDLEGNRG
jgi:hypothetical protein